MPPTLPDLNDIHNPATKTSIPAAWGDAVNAAIAAIDELIPVGGFMPMAMATPPSDAWMLADGRAISRAQYPVLWQRIGTTYGAGDGSTTFNLPDLRGRVIVARNENDAAFNTVGETGGAKTHTLTTAELPSHNHSNGSLATNAAGPTTHMIDGAPMGNGMAWSTGTPQAHRIPEAPSTSNGAYVSFTDVDPHAQHTHNVTGSTGNTGGGGAHNNLQPYMALPVFIRVQ